MPFTPRLRHLAALLALVAALTPSTQLAADPTPAPQGEQRRPRIGLALGGGSVRGLAHVGVLEWLRDHRIPVDAVAGTSMGGLIGGSYAIGMTPQEIKAATQSIDWEGVLSSEAPFDDNTFRRKQDRRAFPSGLELGVRHGLWLPRSLNPGQRVALLLDRLTAFYAGVRDFDDLPTPFRCVAFDINGSERVVLGSGILPEALRATMALPGIFPPVTIGGRLLVDGGLVDNVPADVARDMHADVVIAVDVGASPAAGTEATAFSVLGRSLDAVMETGTKRSLESADVVITPNQQEMVGSLDWSHAEEWRVRGYQAAAAKASELLQYSVSQAEYDAHEAARLARRRTEPIVPVAITVAGVDAGEQVRLLRTLSVAAGERLDFDRLARDLLLLSGTDRYQLVTYHLVADPGGPRLEIDVRPKPNGPAFLTLGLELNNTESTGLAANAAGRTTVYDVVGRGSEIRLDFVVGTRQGVGGELYRPLGAPWLFAAPHVFADHRTRNHFDDGQLVGEYGLTHAGVGLDVGITLGRIAELRAGADIVHVGEEVQVGDPALPGAEGTEKFATAQVAVDTQDSPVMPSRGIHALGRVRRFVSSPDPTGDPAVTAGIESPQRFWQAEFDASVFRRLTRRDRLFVRGAGGTSFGAHPYVEDFSLGGPFRMTAFRNDELRGANFALAGAGYIRELRLLPGWVGTHVYLVTWTECGSTFQSRADVAWHTDISTGIVIDSMIGPLFFGGSAGPGGHARFYISLGPLLR